MSDRLFVVLVWFLCATSVALFWLVVATLVHDLFA